MGAAAPVLEEVRKKSNEKFPGFSELKQPTTEQEIYLDELTREVMLKEIAPGVEGSSLPADQEQADSIARVCPAGRSFAGRF